jgi:CheY-like chemotaxis protein
MRAADSALQPFAATADAGGGTHTTPRDRQRPGPHRAVAEAGGAPGSPARTSVPRTTEAGRGRVLVVDPCEDTVLSTSWLLHLWGYDVRSAPTGPLALVAAHTYRPDVILMELRLPGLDGWQVARRLQRAGDWPTRRMIAVTGCSHARHQARSREAGFDFHLLKPVCPDVLWAHVSVPRS